MVMSVINPEDTVSDKKEVLVANSNLETKRRGLHRIIE